MELHGVEFDEQKPEFSPAFAFLVRAPKTSSQVPRTVNLEPITWKMD